jgi:hypothetical protein
LADDLVAGRMSVRNVVFQPRRDDGARFARQHRSHKQIRLEIRLVGQLQQLSGRSSLPRGLRAIAALEASGPAIRWLGSYQLPRLGAREFLHHTLVILLSGLHAVKSRDKLTNSVARNKSDQQ